MDRVDLTHEEPTAFPAVYSRPGYCVEHTITPAKCHFTVYRFASAVLPRPGFHHIELAAKDQIIHIRINIPEAMVTTKIAQSSGVMLTYFFDTVLDQLRDLLSLVGVDTVDAAEMVEQTVVNNIHYTSRFN